MKKEDAEGYEKIIYHLFRILDDIDTAFDIAKEDDKLLRALILKYIKESHEVTTAEYRDCLFDEYHKEVVE